MPNQGPYYQQGRYLCEIVDHGLTTASTGTLQEAVKFRVLEGTQPQCDVAQYERTAYLAITEKTMSYLVPKLGAMGIDGLKQLKKGDPAYRDLSGVQVEMYCKHEAQSGQESREKWDIASSQSKSLELKPVDDKALRQLDMLFGVERKNSGGGVVSAPRSAKPVPVSAGDGPDPDWGVSDEDVPF
jgi:hypothetical protein